MHFVRRAAARAASASTSFSAQSRAINTSTPSFLLRSKMQSRSIAPSAFRTYSNDTAPAAADGEQSSINGATESATREENPFNNSRDDRGFGNDSRGFRRGSDRPQRTLPLELQPSPSIYIGNLLFEVTAADLEKEFSRFGTVKSSVIATDARQLSKGFGYVQFESVEQAKAAIDAMHQTDFEGRRLVVSYQSVNRRNEQKNPPSKTLFIGNLAFEMSDKDLNNLFKDIRNVVDVRVAIDRRTGQPRGFAHADFIDTESATKGFELLNNKEVYGRRLRIDYSLGSGGSRDREPREKREDSY